ncbi:MAG: hypothetical protein K6357_00170 [Elusimicrobiota bacterium]
MEEQKKENVTTKEEEEKKQNVFSGFENFSFERVFRYNLVLLLFFLFVVGIGSYFLLSDEALKLVGGKRYSELNSNNKGVRLTFIQKIKYLFSDEEVVEAKSKDSSLNPDLALSENLDTAGGEKSLKEGLAKSYEGDYLASNSLGYGSVRTTTERLNPSLSSISGMETSQQSKTSLSSFETGSKASVRVSATNQKVLVAKPGEKNSTSAIELLKNTYKSTLYAARDASNDTARSWTAKAFDLTPDIKETIEYDEKLRAKLDRINPNSIPAFLKDPALDAESMRSLKASDVPGLSEEDKGKDFDIDIDKIKQDFKTAEEQDQNFNTINPNLNLFSNNDQSEDEIDQRSYRVDASNPNVATSPEGKTVTQPSTEPDLGTGISNVSTDEYGYIRVTGDDGMVQIFDPDSGKILGCEDPNAGMCLMPGADNCPQDIYFV